MKDILAFSTPESVGVPSSAISDFIDDIQQRGLMTHSFIIMRHGKICAECYCPPFQVNEFHRMYSTSKTFASIALGILIDDGKVKLDDKVSDYFPEYCPENLPEWIENTTIRDALMMSTAHSINPYSMADDNFVSHTFTRKPDRPSGTIFNYDTNASNCITAIVEKLSGMPYVDFLKERALKEIGFSENAHCIQMPQGGSWGGSGVLCSTRDLARFALLVYNDGYANGKQLLPKDYVIEAKSKQIDNCVNGHKDNLHGYGYGYQIWRIYENGYGFLGMGGQCAFSFPDYDLIYCMTGDVQGNPSGYIPYTEALYYNIIKKLKKHDKSDSLPEDQRAKIILNKKIKEFKAPVPQGKIKTAWSEKVENVVYHAGKNEMGINTFHLTFNDNGGIFHYDTERGKKEIPFKFGEYLISEFPESHYSGKQAQVPLGRGYRSMSAAAWIEEHKLAIRTYIIDDYFGNLNTIISFKGDTAAVKMLKTAEAFLDEYNGEMVGIK